MLIVLCIIFGLLFLVVLADILIIRSDLRHLDEGLAGIINKDTNARLTTRSINRYVLNLAQNINATLKAKREIKLEAQRAEVALKRAITNISHDLRTPLTAAKGYLQMVQDGDLDEETRKKYLAIIMDRVDGLSHLMEDLFEFAHILEGNTTTQMSDVNIINLLQDALSEAYGELTQKGFEVDVNMADSPIVHHTDHDALKRILQNLLKNAHTHGKELLEVSLDEKGITIANKAEGLEGLDVVQMFERFYTSDASRSNKTTGLGLAIAKELAKQAGVSLNATIEGDMLVMRLSFR
ncbi:MAG: HAMP domain-containing histidine kinase [Defluviitaleaceae bacterium]|nr:HAMP domain-containing histidine kinase [Defluviitaleaceae bacterium]